MARAKRTSKQKRRRMAFPALGAAGVSLAMARRRIGNRVYSECTAARFRTPPRHYAR